LIVTLPPTDTFSHFEVLIEEHRTFEQEGNTQPSRLRQLVPTIGLFHTHLPLRAAFEIYNEKHRLTKRKHIQISFNELRHIMNLAQIMALNQLKPGEQCPNPFESSGTFGSNVDILKGLVDDDLQEQVFSQLNGPKLISFDGDQTLYSDGANFDSNPRLANYLYQLLRHGVTVAIVTAAGYEYNVEKYEYRLSGLLHYFQSRGLTDEECGRFYLFGGECNYLFKLHSDYRLHPVREDGPGGWLTATQYLKETPGNWPDDEVLALLDISFEVASKALEELNLRGRVIRKKRSVGLVPVPGQEMTRESLDEIVLRVHEVVHRMNDGKGPGLPYCAFNGGGDTWIDVGNKRVGVQILQSYLGIPPNETLHIGDQFLNTGNDYAARDVAPCIWIINPQETTYVLKSILRLAGVSVRLPEERGDDSDASTDGHAELGEHSQEHINFEEMERRTKAVQMMDVYTGEMRPIT